MKKTPKWIVLILVFHPCLGSMESVRLVKQHDFVVSLFGLSNGIGKFASRNNDYGDSPYQSFSAFAGNTRYWLRSLDRARLPDYPMSKGVDLVKTQRNRRRNLRTTSSSSRKRLKLLLKTVMGWLQPFRRKCNGWNYLLNTWLLRALWIKSMDQNGQTLRFVHVNRKPLLHTAPSLKTSTTCNQCTWYFFFKTNGWNWSIQLATTMWDHGDMPST